MFSSDQWKQADSLHWFESVETNLNQEKENVERKREMSEMIYMRDERSRERAERGGRREESG